jgi:ech hydrogenase subunit A
MVLGILMMIMPPFGLVLGKWMALEAATRNLPVVLLLAAGSALTVMYWARWAGTLLSQPFSGPFSPEKQPFLTWTALTALGLGGLFLGVSAPWLYSWLLTGAIVPEIQLPYTQRGGGLYNSYGAFAVLPLSLVALLGLGASIFFMRWARKGNLVSPYLGGLETENPGIFRGPLNRPRQAGAKNYYLSTLFNERRFVFWFNLTAVGLWLLILAGGW